MLLDILKHLRHLCVGTKPFVGGGHIAGDASQANHLSPFRIEGHFGRYHPVNGVRGIRRQFDAFEDGRPCVKDHAVIRHIRIRPVLGEHVIIGFPQHVGFVFEPALPKRNLIGHHHFSSHVLDHKIHVWQITKQLLELRPMQQCPKVLDLSLYYF